MLKFKNMLDKAIEVFIVTLLTIMVIVALWQVASRYVFNAPSTISEELLRYCLIWLAMIGSAYMFGLREHMNMSFFKEKFSEKVQRNLSVFSEASIILFSVTVLLYGGVNITILTMNQVSAALGIPMGYIYVVLPLSGIFIIFYSIVNIITIIKRTDKVENN